MYDWGVEWITEDEEGEEGEEGEMRDWDVVVRGDEDDLICEENWEYDDLIPACAGVTLCGDPSSSSS